MAFAALLDRFPWIGHMLVVLVLIVVVAGAIIAFVTPSDYTAADYFQDLTIIAASLGVGFGLTIRAPHALKEDSDGSTPSA